MRKRAKRIVLEITAPLEFVPEESVDQRRKRQLKRAEDVVARELSKLVPKQRSVLKTIDEIIHQDYNVKNHIKVKNGMLSKRLPKKMEGKPVVVCSFATFKRIAQDALMARGWSA